MPGLLSNRQDEGVDFELFSNVVLKFTAVLMIILVLLAINVGQKLDKIISPNRFSGGSLRPELILGVYESKNYFVNGSESAITTILYSPSREQIPTKVTEDGTVVPKNPDSDTASGSYSGSIYQTLALLSGVAPGSIAVEGRETSFIVPRYSHKYMVYKDKDNRIARASSSPQLAMGFLRLWSDIYNNPIYPVRAFSEFKNSKTRIYVETSETKGQHTIFIGHVGFNESAMKSNPGLFDFLTGLSSANTEVIYLGSLKVDDAAETSTRIEFYETHGFVDAAKASRSITFPGIAERDLAKSYYEKFPSWDLLPANAKNSYLSNYGGAALARKQYDRTITRQALQNYKNDLLIKALMYNMKPEASALPPNLAYPKAWQSYVDYKLKSNPTPPEWFITEFLQPLGFDKRVTIIE
jgi:hypothetical protein